MNAWLRLQEIVMRMSANGVVAPAIQLPWKQFFAGGTIACAACVPSVSAQELKDFPECRTSKNQHRLELEQKYEFNGIRVFYTQTGPHALYTVADLNRNGVPDMVEDAALHLDTVRQIFNRNGFRDPLDSPRFRHAESIDIDFLNFDVYSPEITDKRGLSFSGVIRYPGSRIRADKCAISMAINSSLKGNHERVKDYLIPHELFHLYQYGYTMFRASWFLEGMAKWAEWVTLAENDRNPTLWSTSLPASAQELNERVFLNPNPYDVRHFWNRLAELAKKKEFPMIVPPELRNRRFADGTPVIRDNIWRGRALMLKILEGLDAEDDAAAQENKIQPYAWANEEQRNTAHNPRLMKVVQRALASYGIAGAEVRQFLAIDPVPSTPREGENRLIPSIPGRGHER